jgi:hypothetical protein
VVVEAEPLSEQISKLMQLLDDPTLKVTEELQKQVLKWVQDLPSSARPPELIRRVARLYDVTEEDMAGIIEPETKKIDFESVMPKGGWLSDYIEYTMKIEPPTAYHFFSGAVAMSSALARNVYFRRGDKDVYPNLAVILVGPSGRVKKTTACQVAVNMLTQIGGNILADKITPESFIETFRDKSEAIGLIYAPELAVFLGKQKYQEGMVPMLTRLLDNPDVWKSGTIMRGEVELKNVGLTLLGASTLDWIQHAIPKDAFGGGFMSRLIFVVQERTPRVFSEPPPMDQVLKKKLLNGLREMTLVRGAFTRTDAAFLWWDRWYRKVTDRIADNKHFAGYLARVPEQAWRIAMLLVISEGKKNGVLKLEVEERHFDQAVKILDWVEKMLPSTFDQLTENVAGADQMKILEQIKGAGGQMGHSDLLRRNSRRMNSLTFKNCINTLMESKLVEFDRKKRMYFATPLGWKQ